MDKKNLIIYLLLITLTIVCILFTLKSVNDYQQKELQNATSTAYQQGYYKGVLDWNAGVMQGIDNGKIPYIYNNTQQTILLSQLCGVKK